MIRSTPSVLRLHASRVAIVEFEWIFQFWILVHNKRAVQKINSDFFKVWCCETRALRSFFFYGNDYFTSGIKNSRSNFCILNHVFKAYFLNFNTRNLISFCRVKRSLLSEINIMSLKSFDLVKREKLFSLALRSWDKDSEAEIY